MTDSRFPDLPGGYPFPTLELEVLEEWKANRIFERTLERPAPEGDFVFYDGPPTANNVPHVGHVVTRVVKDLIPRFRTMRGHRVARKAGWDTHGLPVEIEVEKRLGFSGKQQIEAYGIAEFNRACLESVHTYERQWRAMTERVGYWLDLDDAYWTYKNEYIESVWWALGKLWDQGLLIEGYKIQPYCARCGTTLSSHEVAQNYKETEDPSIWTIFRLHAGMMATDENGAEVDLSGVGLVGWTTTPWTTLANAGVAAHPDLLYKLIDLPGKPGERLLIGEGLGTPVPLAAEIDGHRKQLDLREQPALARFRGKALEGLTYERLFTFIDPEIPGRVVLGPYVTSTEGTGLVHTAPPFGEDDYQTGLRYGLPLWLTVDGEGKMVPAAGELAGLWFKDADPKIIQDLKRRGLMLHSDRYKHNYPFCWRCDRPLLYYATTSWFVRTTQKKDDLVALNRTIAWHPEHVGQGRFGNWLENVVDWALSRRRYWGTPLPVWRCDAEGCNHIWVAGSYAKLFAEAGRDLPENVYDREQFDPHRPYIDDWTWPCPKCAAGSTKVVDSFAPQRLAAAEGARRSEEANESTTVGTMRRVSEVIDAWFDSGAMPFAQHHYLGEPLPEFDPERGIGFPADFISEAVDQTRGWFYTLHALGTLLFGQAAYRHCIVLGHVADEQGRKMSKRLGNVVEPMGVIAETGADAMRWYFCVNNPEINSRFSAKLVREAAQKFLLPLWNAVSFFTIYANLDGWRPGQPGIETRFANRPALDRWVLLRLDRVIEEVTARLDGYDLAEAARTIEAFVDDLTNWYIRRSRGRFWSADAGGSDADKHSAYQALYEVLTTLARVLAPFVPFVAEVLHRHLVRSQDPSAQASVHLEDWPTLPLGRADVQLETGMATVQRIVRLGHAARNVHSLKTRQPLASVTLVAADASLAGAVAPYLDILRDELNVKEVRWAADRKEYVHADVRPVFPKLGKRFGKRMPEIKAALEAAEGEALLEQLEATGKLTIDLAGEPIELVTEEVEIRLVEREGTATQGDRELLVALDTHLTSELLAEGWAREVVSRIQTARKEQSLDYADRIRIRHRAAEPLAAAISTHRDWILGETLGVEMIEATDSAGLAEAPIEGHDFAFAIEKIGR